jgi:myxalamid-type nonribosomal peptide synthetase MxaA
VQTVPLTGNQEGRLNSDERLTGQGLSLPPALLRYAVRLRGPLQVPALQEALAAVVQRHEALRTGIMAGTGGTVQAVQDSADLVLQQTDLGDSADPAGELSRFLSQVASQPLPLDRPPLMRAGLARLSSTEHVLVVAVEHLICDGWSLFVILSDLADFYAAATGHGSAPSQPAPSWLEWSLAEHTWIQGGGLRDEAEQWRSALISEDFLLPPVARPTGTRTYVSTGAAARLEPATVNAFSAELGEGGVSLAAGLLTCFGAALGGAAPGSTVWPLVPVLNRSLNTQESLVGWLANQRPVPIRLSPEGRFDETAEAVQDGLLEAVEYSRAAIYHLGREAAPDRWGRIPPVLTAFTPPYDPKPPSFTELTGTAEPVEVRQWTMGIGLDCPRGFDGSVGLHLAWDSGAFSRPQMTDMLSRIERMVTTVAADPSTPLRE